MKKFNPLKQIIVLLSLLVVALCFVYYFCFVDIQNKNINASELQNKMEAAAKRDDYLMSVRQAVQNSNNDIEKVNDSILGKGDDADFIDLLENTARFDGLEISIDSLNIDDTFLNSADLTTLDVDATVDGGWSDMYVFLNQVESLPFVSRVEKFGLISSSDGTSAGKWSGILEVRVLEYK
jgi:Tfp pilus assembly protein PilO